MKLVMQGGAGVWLSRTALAAVALPLAVVAAACASTSTAAQFLLSGESETVQAGPSLVSSPTEAIEEPGPSSASPFGQNPRLSEGGQVALMVTWQAAEPELVFAVQMDTHSVDLDGYDLRELAVLRTNEGREAAPIGWQAPRGGHHRQGALVFPLAAADGAPLIGQDTRLVELVVRDVGGVPERVLQWSR
jgi:hypothetical protein